MKTDNLVKVICENIGLKRLGLKTKKEALYCLICGRSDLDVNWISNLQDCLEDAEVSLEKFCKKSGSFSMDRGRLRAESASCTDLRTIKKILESL
jgi:hypothetical protein